MARTLKKYPWNVWRRPRCRKQAVVNKARYKSIPPSDWDDLPFDKQVYKPIDIAIGLASKGKSFASIESKLVRKYRLDRRAARAIALLYSS